MIEIYTLLDFQYDYVLLKLNYNPDYYITIEYFQYDYVLLKLSP